MTFLLTFTHIFPRSFANKFNGPIVNHDHELKPFFFNFDDSGLYIKIHMTSILNYFGDDVKVKFIISGDLDYSSLITPSYKMVDINRDIKKNFLIWISHNKKFFN